MNLKMFFAALFSPKNVLCAFIIIILAKILMGVKIYNIGSFMNTNFFYIYLIGFLLMVVLTINTTFNEKFREGYEKNQKVRSIRRLNSLCNQKWYEVKKHVPYSQYAKIKKLIVEKEDIVTSFYKSEKTYVKEKTTEQYLQLTKSYIELFDNYSRLENEKDGNFQDVISRLNNNTRKIGFIKDPKTCESIKKMIDMDEKIIERLKNSKLEKERLKTNLEYIESTLMMLKSQILSAVESEEIIEKVEEVLKETEALDNVLEERKRRIGRKM
jgi:hypothetical protein